MEDTLRDKSTEQLLDEILVLILVLMEDTLREGGKLSVCKTCKS